MRTTKETNINTERLLQNSMELYNENIDFLTIKIFPTGNSIYQTLDWLVNNSDSMILDFWLKVIYSDIVAGGQLKVLHLLDEKNNLLAFIHIKQPTEKKNKNFNSDIELVWLFWKSYSHLFDYICNLFHIDPDKRFIVSRIDYCFDIKGLEVADLLEYTANKYKKSYVIKYGDTPTYTNTKWDRHELCLYNKKLDILDKNKHKLTTSDGSKPYAQYLSESESITRIEYRKKTRAIKEIVENSPNGLFKYIRQMACDYIQKMYDIDFQLVLSKLESPLQRLDRPKRIDIVTRWISDKKASKYLSMSLAYAGNYCLLKSEHLFFEHLYQTYGDRIGAFMTEKQIQEIKQIF